MINTTKNEESVAVSHKIDAVNFEDVGLEYLSELLGNDYIPEEPVNDIKLQQSLSIARIEPIEPEVITSAEPQTKLPAAEQPISFTDLEHSILQKLAEGTSAKGVSKEIGVPLATITKFVQKKEVQEYLNESIKARNLVIKTQLPTMLLDIIDAKLQRLNENPELSLADATKKDVVDIAKILADVVKIGETSDKQQELTGFQLIYNQLNVLNDK